MTNTVYVELEYTPEPEGRADDASRWQPWRLLVRAGGNNAALLRSTERYTNKGDAVHAAELAFGEDTTVILRQENQPNYQLRLAISERRAANTPPRAELDEQKCEHGYGIRQGPCPTCDAPKELRDADTCGMGDE